MKNCKGFLRLQKSRSNQATYAARHDFRAGIPQPVVGGSYHAAGLKLELGVCKILRNMAAFHVSICKIVIHYVSELRTVYTGTTLISSFDTP